MSAQTPLRDILCKSTAYLEQKGVDSPRLSAELMVAHGLGIDRLGLYLDLDRPLTELELSRIRPLLIRRGGGEPVAYILNRKEFYGLNFIVSRDVLIPRPETELGVDTARELFRLNQGPMFADVGTGSGALAVALLVHLPNARCLASDISRPALAVARSNCLAHHVHDRIMLTQANLLSHVAEASLDLIIANLPYLSEIEFSTVSMEVSEFEPPPALVAGPRGDELFSPLVKQAMRVLHPGGHLLMETGSTQAEQLARTIAAFSTCWTGIKIINDLGGLNRYVLAIWSPAENRKTTSDGLRTWGA